MKSPILVAAAAVCLALPALASELVVTNETQTYASGLDLPFLDASNLLKVGEGGSLVSQGNMSIGWSNNVSSAHNTDATNVFTVSGGGQFIYDNGGVAATSGGFRLGTWTAPKRRSLVTYSGPDTIVDLRDAYVNYINGNTAVEIEDGATVYMGRYAGMGNMPTTRRSEIETTMTISGDDTKIYISPSGWINVGHSDGNFTSNRVVMTGGSIKPLNPSSTGYAKILVGNGNATDALFDMRGGSIDLWVTNNSNPGVNCSITIGPGNGEFKMSGGSVYCGDFYVGANQPGSAGYEERVTTHRPRLRMLGGTLNCSRLYLGSSNANTTFKYQEAHVDLDGGVLIARSMAFVSKSALFDDGYAHGYLTANGGTLRSGSSAGHTLLSKFDTAELGPKGLTLDTGSLPSDKVASVSQSFSDKEGEEGVLRIVGSAMLQLKPDRYYTVSKTVVDGADGAVKLLFASNTVLQTSLVITNGGSVSLDGAVTQLTVDSLIVPDGKLWMNAGDKIHVTSDNVDFSGLKIHFNPAPSSGTPYSLFTFDGDVTGNAKIRNAMRFIGNSNTVSGNYSDRSLIYDEGTGKTSLTMTFTPNASALSDETVWNGPAWDDSGWSDGVPTAEKVASFSNAAAPTAVAVPAGGEAGAISVSSGADYVLSGDGLEISGGNGGLWFDVSSGSATFNLPVGLMWRLPMTLAAGSSAKFNDPITGGGLTKTGKGALTLGADNHFRLSVSMGGGFNTVASAGALNNEAKSATLTDDTLVFTNSVDDAEMVVSTPVILNSATSTTNAVVVKADSDVRLKDLTVSKGALVKRGKGRLTIEASETKNTKLSSGYGATLSGNNYRVLSSSLVAFAADGTAPAPEDQQYAGFNVAEGEVVIEGDTNRTMQVKAVTGFCIGMHVAGDAATFAQPTLTIDGANIDTAGQGHTTIGTPKTGADGCAVVRPTLRVVNGGRYHAGNIRLGNGANNAGVYPTLAVTNGRATAGNAIRFEVTGGTDDRASFIRAKDSTLAVTSTGGSHHGIYLSGTVDADFDNCFFGGTAQTGILRYQGVSAGTMRFRNGSVFAAYPYNDVARSDYAMTLVFDDAEWRWGGGDVTLSYTDTAAGWCLYKPGSSTTTSKRDIKMEGVGVIMKPNAGCTFTTQVPFKGAGGFVAAGEGAVKFTGNTLQFTGLVDIRSGTVDLTAADARETLTVRGPGTLKGGSIATLTISETFADGTAVGAPVLDGVTANLVVVDFGRDESSPMEECENILVATYSMEDPPTIGKWMVSGTGISHVKGRFTVSGGEVRASVAASGFVMIVR